MQAIAHSPALQQLIAAAPQGGPRILEMPTAIDLTKEAFIQKYGPNYKTKLYQMRDGGTAESIEYAVHENGLTSTLSALFPNNQTTALKASLRVEFPDVRSPTALIGGISDVLMGIAGSPVQTQLVTVTWQYRGDLYSVTEDTFFSAIFEIGKF